MNLYDVECYFIAPEQGLKGGSLHVYSPLWLIPTKECYKYPSNFWDLFYFIFILYFLDIGLWTDIESSGTSIFNIECKTIHSKIWGITIKRCW